MIKRLAIILFVTQFLTCDAMAQADSRRIGRPPIKGGEYSVSETVKRAKELILKEKQQLEGAGKSEGISKERVIPKGGEYDVSDTVKSGKEIIRRQKQELEAKEKSEEEIRAELEEKEEETKRKIYEQKIIEEATMPRPTTWLERELQREKFRREIMAAAGREAEIPFKLRKRFNLKLSETYDDNIYLTKTNKKKDYITQISPSVLFSLSSKYAILDANYVMDIKEYKNRKDQSGISHLLMTYIRPGSLALPFFNRRRGKIGLEIQDNFQPLITNVATSEQTERTDRTYNKLFLTVDYYMSTKRTLSFEYMNEYQDYRGTTLESYSYTHQIFSPVFYFHVRPKWSLFTAYDYGIFDYSKGTNGSTYQRLRTGLTGTIFTKVLTRLETGKEWRTYEDSKNGDAQKLFFKSALIDKFTPFTTGWFQYNHTMVESYYGANPYYISDDISLDVEHKFTYKTIGTFGLGYTRNSYDRKTTEDEVTKKRRDTIWEPSMGLKYYIKRKVYIELRYLYRKRTSNFGKFDYVDNRIMGGINIGF